LKVIKLAGGPRNTENDEVTVENNMHELSNSTEVPMAHIPYETLCPGSAVLDKLKGEYR
jgi:hypothetical protein